MLIKDILRESNEISEPSKKEVVGKNKKAGNFSFRKVKPNKSKVENTDAEN